MRLHSRLVVVLAMAALIGGCTDARRSTVEQPTPTGEPGVTLLVPDGTPDTVASGLEAPWEVVFHEGTALISLRNSGDVLELREDGSTRPVGTVPGVESGGEAGLLGMAVGPNGDLYTYSTAAEENRIQRFTIEGDAGSYALGAGTTVLDGIPAHSFHDGGRIAFGPDGLLYASVGDAGDAGGAQDRDRLNGKILRMTPSGDVPEDNPTPGSLVYSLGHRNVQGLAWASDGTMFAAEFGQDAWDELNIIEPGGNYGWPDVEGAGGDDRFVDPVQAWPTEDASPSGIVIINDTLFVANLRGERLRAIPTSRPGTAREFYVGEYGRIRSVLAGPGGALWFVTNNTDGRGSPREDDDRILSVPLAAG